MESKKPRGRPPIGDEEQARRTPARFWAKVDKNGPMHPTLGSRCWLWTGARQGQGYGLFAKTRTGLVVAHRFAYEMKNGPIDRALLVCHRCDHPTCVRPSHLFAGTPSDNMQDCVAKGRVARMPGEANPAARFTNAEAESIRDEWIDGASKASLARKHGVSFPTIADIVAGRSYKAPPHR